MRQSGRPQPRREFNDAEKAAMDEKVRKTEVAISLVLRVGVSVSVVVIGIGLGLMFAHHSQYSRFSGNFSYHSLTSSRTAFPYSFGALARSLSKFRGEGVVVLGVLLLILTPILRVAVGALSFIYEKDGPMTIVTLYVLAVLIASFFLAGA